MPTAIDYIVVAGIGYFGVGAVKLALTLPTLKLAIAYSLFLEGKDKNTLLRIVAYSLVAVFMSLLGWPLIMKSEGLAFFRAYTKEEVIAAVDEAYASYDCYQDRRM